MEKTKREEWQKTGRWARWISRAYLSLALAAVVLTVRTCCPGAVETVRDVLGLGTAQRPGGYRRGGGEGLCGGVRRVVSGACR